MKSMLKFGTILVLLLTLNHPFAPARAQGTAFTYQGRLNDGASPANGSYDLVFTLFATDIKGLVIAGPVTNAATAVVNGFFTTTIDFGTGVFNGSNYWLEIGVCTNGGGAFTTLARRQGLTAAPYAITAQNASQLGGQSPSAFAPASGSPEAELIVP